ncbi:DUF6691 family protein [Sulfuriroseicoccus oceanibius]|uniref:YeeE/YedE family protein n=1 Tax=Sulfuriroseicoccus oceanibius TaxID=2707525 RepID=A0A6B3L720_9BACT|nr:DUF6691 family protein [Sulfuriroseicoccus oceanibius]QQL45217.1 YeeE/YedE family protein [Sulfuriroseicoccus oceanibius]
MDILLALLLGGLFGFVLERAGAANPDKIIGMLTLKDLHLMKAIFSAIGIASLLLFAGVAMGLVEISHLSIKGMYPGVLIGGALLGLGWALGGFCPGTGVVAAGRGRKDALTFILGGLVGAWIFTLQYEGLAEAGWMESWFGGKATLVDTGAKGATPLLEGEWTLVLAMAIGLAMLAIGKVLPLHPSGED